MKWEWIIAALVLVTLGGCRAEPPHEVADATAVVNEIHQNPQLVRQVIDRVIAEPHGVDLIAERLAENPMAAETVVDALMKKPELAKAIRDRCASEAISSDVNKR